MSDGKKLAISLVDLAVGIFNLWFGAYVFVTMWGWFIVTIFSEYNVQPLLWIEGFAILTIIGLVKTRGTDFHKFLKQEKRNEVEKLTVNILWSLYYLMGFGMGYLITLFL